MGILREARQARHKAKRLGKRAGGGDGAVIFIGVGMAAVAGLVWYGIEKSKGTTTTATTSVSTTGGKTWIQTTGGIAPGAQFALVIPVSSLNPAVLAAIDQAIQSIPGVQMTGAGVPPPTGWPIANDGGGNAAIRAMGVKNTSVTMPVNPPVLLWTLQ